MKEQEGGSWVSVLGVMAGLYVVRWNNTSMPKETLEIDVVVAVFTLPISGMQIVIVFPLMLDTNNNGMHYWLAMNGLHGALLMTGLHTGFNPPE